MTRLFQQHRPRILLVNFMFAAMLLAITAKLFHIQITLHKVYRQQALRQGSKAGILPAQRGVISDRNGKPLTTNVVNYSFAADPQVLLDKPALAQALSRTFNRPVGDYLAKLRSDKEFVWLERNVPREMAGSLPRLSLPGFLVMTQMNRRYPHGRIAGPLLGRTDVDNRGISGIELQYDELLRGEAGWQRMRRNARGQVWPRPDDLLRKSNKGAEIRLTIDIAYQSIFQEEMALAAERLGAQAINGILIDPHTGDILALAQYPSMDANRTVPTEASARRPQAITDMYEPGSTLKVVTAIAALEKGLFTAQDSLFVENGTWQYYHLIIEDTRPRGTISFGDILAYSSNIGIIKVAERLGARALYHYSTQLGLGVLTGIDLPGETAGILREPGDWSAISTGEIAMGHEIGVTTLQLAMLYSAIANGGLLLEPRLVAEIHRDGKLEKTRSRRIIRRVASEATMAHMRRFLQGAVDVGTASTARIPGFTLAGKTGTAQKFVDGAYSRTEFISTFAALFPAGKPRLVCVVAVDEPAYGQHFGSQAAAPVARNTIRRILNLDNDLYMPLYGHPLLAGSSPPAGKFADGLLAISREATTAATGIVPDFKGYSLRAALKLAQRRGIDLRVTGSGQVVRQSIEPGVSMEAPRSVLLTLANVESTL